MSVDSTLLPGLMRHCLAGEWTQAERLCEVILASEPRRFVPLLVSAEIALRRGDLARARERLRRAGETPSSDIGWLTHLTNLMARAGDFESAARILKVLLRIEPRHVDALCGLGEVSAALGRIDEAVAAYEAASALAPAQARSFTARSILLLRRAWGSPLPSPPDKQQIGSPSGRIAMTSLGKNGRLGNQIIQYAFLRLYARVHHLQVEVPGWIGRWLFDLDDPHPGDPLPRFEEAPAMGALLSESAPPVLANRDLWGYFGCHTSYLRPHQRLFRTLFRPGARLQPVVDRAMGRLTTLGRTLVAVHLRRGDYKGGALFWPAPSSWYVDWLSAIWRGLEDPVLYVASDDADAQRDFAPFSPVTAEDLGERIPGAEMYPDFHVLARADLLAISNSSFSMCAAMLNERARSYMRPDPSARRLVPFDPWDAEKLLRAAGSDLEAGKAEAGPDPATRS